MSATIEQPPTVSQRTISATTQLQEIFGFKNLKALSAAIAEAAVKEARANPAFAERVRTLYQEFAPTKEAATPKGKQPSERPKTKLKATPIARVEGYIPDPYGPLDPSYMLKIYGPDQLPLALDDHTLDQLKVAADNLMKTHPGTKPKTKSKKADVIAYIVEIVTGKQ
jgi:hypothetical protein